MSHRIARCNYIEMHRAQAGGGKEGGRGEGERKDGGERRGRHVLYDSLSTQGCR